MQEICGLVARDQGSFRLMAIFPVREELGVSGWKRSEKEQCVHCGTPGRESQPWRTEKSLGSMQGPNGVVHHAFIVEIVTRLYS